MRGLLSPRLWETADGAGVEPWLLACEYVDDEMSDVHDRPASGLWAIHFHVNGFVYFWDEPYLRFVRHNAARMPQAPVT